MKPKAGDLVLCNSSTLGPSSKRLALVVGATIKTVVDEAEWVQVEYLEAHEHDRHAHNNWVSSNKMKVISRG